MTAGSALASIPWPSFIVKRLYPIRQIVNFFDLPSTSRNWGSRAGL